MIQPRPHRLMSDDRLAALAVDGDERAFAALYHRYEKGLLGHCRSITLNAEDARDALQNAMARAFPALARRNPEAPVRAWLFRIAHNEAINVVRRRPAHLPLGDPDAVPVTAGADERMFQRETALQALADVRALPPRQRTALALRELAGLGYGEIAVALDVSEGNARQLVFQARNGIEDTRTGRQLSCESVRSLLATGDRRVWRRRRLRAHLRSCDACRALAGGASAPAGLLGALLPKWMLGGAGLLQSVVGAGGGATSSATGELMARPSRRAP